MMVLFCKAESLQDANVAWEEEGPRAAYTPMGELVAIPRGDTPPPPYSEVCNRNGITVGSHQHATAYAHARGDTPPPEYRTAYPPTATSFAMQLA